MRKAATIQALCIILILGLAGLSVGAQDFDIGGRQLSVAECELLVGGETYVSVENGRSVARVVSIPRDEYGMDYSRATAYEVETHNRITKAQGKGENDFYDVVKFPVGRSTMNVALIPDSFRQGRYGSSNGEWIRTDATTMVTAYPIGADGKPDKTKPFMRADAGYFWHANNAAPFSGSVSAGCLISRQKDLDRVIVTLKSDRGPKSLTVRDR